MTDPRPIEVPWQQAETPDAEVFPDDFEEEPDEHLERELEDRYDTEGHGLFYTEGIIESMFNGPEPYEPSVYDGTYSEE